MIILTNGYPQGPNGLIVPNGSIKFQLNVDATVIAAPGGFVAANIPVVFQFNHAGQVQPNPPAIAAQIWSNEELQPQLSPTLLGTYYLVTFYDQNGAILNVTPLWWQFPEVAGSTVDISQMTPISTVGGNIIFYPTNFGGGGGGSVTSVTFTGDGTILSATPSAAVTTTGTLTATLLTQSANLVLAGPTTGAAAAPTFRALVLADLPAGIIAASVPWNNLTAATGNLVLANTTFNTTFNQTSSTTNWTWANINPATSIANHNSPNLILAGTYWNGAASAADQWTIQNVLGTGTNPTPTLTFIHTGSSGQATISFGGSVSVTGGFSVANAITGTQGAFAFQTGSAGSVFAISSAANAIGNLTTYQAVIPAGQQPVFGQFATIAGFITGANNGRFGVSSATTTSITVFNSAGASETHVATGTIDQNFINQAGYDANFGVNANFSIQGTVYKTNAAFEALPNYPQITFNTKGDATDAGYIRIINDGVTGNHGLEIGSIIDGTGAAPVTFQLGYFNGAPAAVLNVPLTLFGATPTGTTGQLSFGTTAGIGNGVGTNLTAPALGTGTGPASMVAVKWLELDIAGTKYWYPLFQ